MVSRRGRTIRSNCSHKSSQSSTGSGHEADKSSSSTDASPFMDSHLSHSQIAPVLSSTARASAASHVRRREVGVIDYTTQDFENSASSCIKQDKNDVKSELSEKPRKTECRQISSGTEKLARAISAEDSPKAGPSNILPLDGVKCLVDCWCGKTNMNSSITTVLTRLGAEVRSRMSKEITHAIFHEGKRLKMDKLKTYPNLKIVSMHWVERCMLKNIRAKEDKFAPVERQKIPAQPATPVDFSQRTTFARKKKKSPDRFPDIFKSITVESVIKKTAARDKRVWKTRIKTYLKNVDINSPGPLPPIRQKLYDAMNGIYAPVDVDVEESDDPIRNEFDHDSIDSTVDIWAKNNTDKSHMKLILKDIEDRERAEAEEMENESDPMTPIAHIVFQKMYTDPNAKYAGTPVPEFLKVHIPRNKLRENQLNNENTPLKQNSIETEETNTISVDIGSISMVTKKKTPEQRTVGVNTKRIRKEKETGDIPADSVVEFSPERAEKIRKEQQIDDIIQQVCKMSVVSPSETPKGRGRAKGINKAKKPTNRRQKDAKDIKISREKMTRMFESGDENDPSFQAVCSEKDTKSNALNAIINRPSDDDFYPRINRTRTKLNTIVILDTNSGVREVAQAATARFGGFKVGLKIHRGISHVIVGNTQVFSVESLMACALGCWMLPSEWLYSSIEAGRWLNEGDYELKQTFPAAHLRRVQGGDSGVLSSLGNIYVSECCSLPCSELVALVKFSGGKVTSSRLRAQLIINDDVTNGRDNLPRTPTDARFVTSHWLCTCVHKNVLQI